jgi:hypothetical protein
VAQLSGHKNYGIHAVASKDQQKKMSHTISGVESAGTYKLKNVINNPCSSQHATPGTAILPGFQISGNEVVVNIHFHSIATQGQTIHSSAPSKKRKPMIFDSDSDMYVILYMYHCTLIMSMIGRCFS